MKPYLLFLLLLPSFVMAQSGYDDIKELSHLISNETFRSDGYKANISGDEIDRRNLTIEISHPKVDVPIAVTFYFDGDQKLISIKPGTIDDSNRVIDVSILGKRLEMQFLNAQSRLGPNADVSPELLSDYMQSLDLIADEVNIAFKSQLIDKVKPDMKIQIMSFLTSWSYMTAAFAVFAGTERFATFENYTSLKIAVLASLVGLGYIVNPLLKQVSRHFYDQKRLGSKNYKEIALKIDQFITSSTRTRMLRHCQNALRESYFKPN